MNKISLHLIQYIRGELCKEKIVRIITVQERLALYATIENLTKAPISNAKAFSFTFFSSPFLMENSSLNCGTFISFCLLSFWHPKGRIEPMDMNSE